MSSRNDPRRVRFPSRTQDDFAEEPAGEDLDIGLECAMPALQEYLRDIAELDAQVSRNCRH